MTLELYLITKFDGICVFIQSTKGEGPFYRQAEG